MSENDNIESEFDFLIEYLKSLQMEEKRRGTIQILNPNRIAEMEKAYNLLYSIAKEENPDAKIRCGIDDFSGAGYITIEGDTVFTFRDLKTICDVFRYLSNIEIIIVRGRLQINCMFYGVTRTQLLSETN